MNFISLVILFNLLAVLGIIYFTLYSTFKGRWEPTPQGLSRSQAIEGKPFSFQVRNERVVVDPQARTVTFFNCHRSRDFWVFRSAPEFTCALDDVLAVYRQVWLRGDRETRIVTRFGKACLIVRKRQDADADLERIRDYLASVCQHKEPLKLREAPMFPVFIGGLITVGLIALILYLT